MDRYFTARVRESINIHDEYCLLTLTYPSDSDKPLPGQFFMTGVTKNYDPLLKRAFSLFRMRSDDIQILFRIKGKGTISLSSLKEGDAVEVLGPLGNHYPLPKKRESPLVVAGGIGIASVFSLVEVLNGQARLFYGARSARELLMLDELKKFAGEMTIATDDGSQGMTGSVIAGLEKYLGSETGQNDTSVIYACGPRPMLKEISRISDHHSLTAYVSLEEHMACGIGACLGCAVPTAGKSGKMLALSKGLDMAGEIVYKKVCKDGPVFRSSVIVW